MFRGSRSRKREKNEADMIENKRKRGEERFRRIPMVPLTPLPPCGWVMGVARVFL